MVNKFLIIYCSLQWILDISYSKKRSDPFKWVKWIQNHEKQNVCSFNEMELLYLVQMCDSFMYLIFVFYMSSPLSVCHSQAVPCSSWQWPCHSGWPRSGWLLHPQRGKIRQSVFVSESPIAWIIMDCSCDAVSSGASKRSSVFLSLRLSWLSAITPPQWTARISPVRASSVQTAGSAKTLQIEWTTLAPSHLATGSGAVSAGE